MGASQWPNSIGSRPMIPHSANVRFAPGAVVRREHVTFNHGVEGSSPSALTKRKPLRYSYFLHF